MSVLRPFVPVLALVALSLPALGYSGVDYLPNQEGNHWSFEVSNQYATGAAGQRQELEVTGRSGGWARMAGFPGLNEGRWLWMSSQSGRIYIWNPGAGSYGVLFDLGVAEGGTFASEHEAGCLASEWQVEQAGATVVTPAGRFDDCLVLASGPLPCPDTGLRRLVFAPEVGLVQFEALGPHGPSLGQLVHARVDGREYSHIVRGVSVCLTIDDATYTQVLDEQHQLQGAPATLRARLEIRNDTQREVRFDYVGQRADFFIRDAQGRTVYHWAADKHNRPAPGSDVLPAGQALDYQVEISLTRDGNYLPEGRYLLEAIHLTDEPQLRLRSSVSFQVRESYPLNR